MSKVADSIRRGLEKAVAYAKGEADECAYGVHIPERIDVKAIRTNLGMAQEEFAGRFGFSVDTPRHWEQGSSQPEGPTRAYLLGSLNARPKQSRRPCWLFNAPPPRGCHSQFCSEMAEGAGFEPAIGFPLYTLSRRAPSTTRPPLRFSSNPSRSFKA